MRSKQNVLALVALAAVALIAILTRREEPAAIDSYASSDYASGGYRAYAELLAREGLRTGTFVQRPAELRADVDTLISAQPLAFAPDAVHRQPAELADLATWVRHGGHLVYIGRAPDLATLEAQRLRLPPIALVRTPRGPLRGTFAPLVHRLDGVGTLRLSIVPRRDIELLIGDDSGAIAVRYPLGRGDVVAVSDANLLTNAVIAHDDNARFAVLIAQPHHRGGLIAFDEAVHGELVDRPWYRALTSGQQLAAAIAALAMVLGLIGGALRGGRAVRLEAPREPTSAEFVDALAALRQRIQARTETRDALAASLAPRDEQLAATDAKNDERLLAIARVAYERRKESLHGRSSDRRREAFGRRARASHRRQ